MPADPTADDLDATARVWSDHEILARDLRAGARAMRERDEAVELLRAVRDEGTPTDLLLWVCAWCRVDLNQGVCNHHPDCAWPKVVAFVEANDE